MEERNKLWRRKQQYRLLKSRIVKRADGFRGFMLDDGTYVQHPHWTQLIKSHWAQVYKTTGTPCSCPLCQGESYSRLAYKHDTKRIIEESEMYKKHFGEKSQRLSRVRVAPQYGFLCVMDL